MTSEAEPEFGFVFDQHVSRAAVGTLRSRGVDVVHVADVGLDEATDAEILLWSKRERRVVVTRNYRDFAPLVRACAKRGERFPGVLFLARGVGMGDVGAHVRALEAWLQRARELGRNTAQNSYDWLR